MFLQTAPLRVVATVDADDVAEVARAAGLHAGERVLEHRRLRRLNPEELGALEERVGCGLALEALLGDRLPVDARLEAIGDAGRLERLLGVRARRDDRGPQAAVLAH